MGETSLLSQAHTELADEHQAIMALVEQIGGTHEVVALPPLLEALHDSLIDHFAHEQFPGGLYECMGAYDARYHEDIRELVREHCVLLSTIRGLVERSQWVARDEETKLLNDVSGFVSALESHERKEHRLVRKLRRDAMG